MSGIDILMAADSNEVPVENAHSIELWGLDVKTDVEAKKTSPN